MGRLRRCVCRVCGETEMVTGSNCSFRCSSCRPTRTLQDLAHAAVAKAIRTGVMQRAQGLACADCGGAAIEYDHRDYHKPLDVQPVCRRCNLRRGPAIGSPARRAARFDSLNSHSSSICLGEPLNTTHQIREVL